MMVNNVSIRRKCPWVIVFSIVFVVFCTDVKVSVVKISEIGLLAYFILFSRKLDKPIRKFLFFFLGFVGITFVHNLFLTFDYSPVDSFLKRPYMCTIGRFAEVLSCLVLMQLILKISRKYNFQNFINRFFRCSYWFSLVILVLFFLYVVGAPISFLDLVDEGTFRLTGFYVEGGPFGLMCASMALLGIHLNRRKKEIGIFVILTILAQSKAGIVCILGYFCVKFVQRFYKSKTFRICIVLIFPIAIIVFVKLFMHIADMYISAILDTNTLAAWVNANPEDYASTAGRIPATFIVSNMFLDNPFIGIGIGNYPVLRNLPEYRSFFPKIDVYDATGYGGFVDMLNQCGLLGLGIFCMLLYKTYKYGCNRDFTYLLLFCLPLLFGVQYTFAYPWLMLAFLLIPSNLINPSKKRL